MRRKFWQGSRALLLVVIAAGLYEPVQGGPGEIGKKKDRAVKDPKEQTQDGDGVAWEDAKPLGSPHYRLKCNSPPWVGARYLKLLERLYERYSEVCGDFEPTHSGLLVVNIFRNEKEFLAFNQVPEGVGGFFNPMSKEVSTFHGYFGFKEDTDQVMAHECTHQFQHRIFKNFPAVPFWLIESMAVYFSEGSMIRQEKIVPILPRLRLKSLQKAITDGSYVPLSSLLRISPWDKKPFFSVYDHGWGLVFWMLHGDEPLYKKFGHRGAGRRVWDRYLRHVAKELKEDLKRPDAEGEARYFADLILEETAKEKRYSSIEAWEAQYKKFIMNLPLPPLGKWTGEMKWDGASVGIMLRFPGQMRRVEEKDLREGFEVAAATTPDGLRFWLSVYPNRWLGLDDQLRFAIEGVFADPEYDPEFRPKPVKLIPVNKVLPVAVSKFRVAKPERQAVRAALFVNDERLYLLFLAGPEEPFSLLEPEFDRVLGSVRLIAPLKQDR